MTCPNCNHVDEIKLNILGYEQCTKCGYVFPDKLVEVTEECQTGLHEVIKNDCFKNKELAEERGWYRKFFYCRECGLLIRTETWDEHYMFGCSTVLKDNQTPNFCPNCGTRTDG